jgi:hypothetical protein
LDPTPELAKPNPGLRLAAAINSAIEFTPKEGWVASTTGWRDSAITGTSSAEIAGPVQAANPGHHAKGQGR